MTQVKTYCLHDKLTGYLYIELLEGSSRLVSLLLTGISVIKLRFSLSNPDRVGFSICLVFQKYSRWCHLHLSKSCCCGGIPRQYQPTT
ncbi:hypothetical protein Mapa_005976 [Marchantia paleacea]|nr:hypothetical protein Mapa_005976 [Marchantia paleacea]